MPHTLTVIASLEARGGLQTELLQALRDDRRETLANEAGVSFTVLTDDANDRHFILHEEYPDRAAFERHKRMPYFAAFEAAVARCCTGPADVRLLAAATPDPM